MPSECGGESPPHPPDSSDRAPVSPIREDRNRNGARRWRRSGNRSRVRRQPYGLISLGRRPLGPRRESPQCFCICSAPRGSARQCQPAKAPPSRLDKAAAERGGSSSGQRPSPAPLRRRVFSRLRVRRIRRQESQRAVSLPARFPYDNIVSRTRSDARTLLPVGATPCGAVELRLNFVGSIESRPTKRMLKRLLSRSWPLWFNRYAQANRSKEDPQVGGQTLQDYRPGEDFAGAKLAPPLALGKKSEAQTSARQVRARRQNRRGADQKQPAVC